MSAAPNITDEMRQAGNEAISAAISVLSSSIPDDDDMDRLNRLLVRLGLLYKCAGCGYYYAIDGSDAYCERRYDDCPACLCGEAHPHWQRKRRATGA